jgi:hypothetical protein
MRAGEGDMWLYCGVEDEIEDEARREVQGSVGHVGQSARYQAREAQG